MGNVRGRQVTCLRIEAEGFDQRSGSTRCRQPRVDEVDAQRPQKGVRETLDDDLWRLAEPDGGKRRQGDEVAEIATEFGGIVHRVIRRRPDTVRLQPVSLRAQFSAVGFRPRSSRRSWSGGTKNGFSWRVPPMIAIGCVRRTSITTPALNCVRS